MKAYGYSGWTQVCVAKCVQTGVTRSTPSHEGVNHYHETLNEVCVLQKCPWCSLARCLQIPATPRTAVRASSLTNNTGGSSGSSIKFQHRWGASPASPVRDSFLTDNGGDNLTVTANGAFTFQTLASPPLRPLALRFSRSHRDPTQTCVVTGEQWHSHGHRHDSPGNLFYRRYGERQCNRRPSHRPAGQWTFVLQDNGADNLPVKKAIEASISPRRSPPAQPTVSQFSRSRRIRRRLARSGNGSGTASSTVGNIVVTCSSGTILLGGSVSGLAGTGLVLRKQQRRHVGGVGGQQLHICGPPGQRNDL